MLGIKDSVVRIHGSLRLGGIALEALGFFFINVRGSSTVTLVIGNDLHTIILPNADTTVCCAQVNTNRFSSDSCAIGIKRVREC